MRRLTTEEFIKKAKKVHGDRYDYSKVEYIKNNVVIKIICPKHGSFKQMPSDHLSGYGCFKCGIESSSKNRKLDIEGFVKKANKIHKNKYNYSKVKYINNNIKIIIICSKHGEFLQTPASHLQGCGCPYCYGCFQSNTEDFIKKAILKHGNNYDYSKVKYINAKIKVKIICPKHGKFKQLPSTHLYGQGCPYCKKSKGEKVINIYLKNKNIKYISQKRFNGCKYKHTLSFDFYLPNYNLCIEYDGIQHYKPIRFSGMSKNKAEKCFDETIKKDKIKNEYCKNNNIKLLRIKYDQFNNIEEIIEEYLKKLDIN